VYTATVVVNDVAPTISLAASASLALRRHAESKRFVQHFLTGVTYSATVDYDYTGVGGTHSAVNLPLNVNNNATSAIFIRRPAPIRCM